MKPIPGDRVIHGYRLESVELRDTPTIERNDNGEYKPSLALSIRQKCTAVPPILLLDSAKTQLS
ncbi:MAG: hypothetical protein JXB13_22710 [Phycisphaerae bacterium]|nr:hypothetical protein [Phycisphaerae bacterium]